MMSSFEDERADGVAMVGCGCGQPLQPWESLAQGAAGRRAVVELPRDLVFGFVVGAKGRDIWFVYE
jgi:hypothetical protein